MRKNPSAFPSTTAAGTTAFGMTLRDYFAAKAMVAYLSQNTGNGRLPVPSYADAAYCMADAMLEARK